MVHGWGGSSAGDWLPWLRGELEKLGHEVIAPNMPDTNNPTIEAWVGKLAEVVGAPDENTYFVGHSIGCQTILRYLEKINTPVGGAIFVAGWFGLENLESYEEADVARPWIETPIDIEKIKKVLPQSTLIISDNDPYGAFEENKQKFSEFVTKTAVFPGREHFNDREAPEILAECELLLK